MHSFVMFLLFVLLNFMEQFLYSLFKISRILTSVFVAMEAMHLGSLGVIRIRIAHRFSAMLVITWLSANIV